MRRVFFIAFAVLVAASVVLYATLPGHRGTTPVLYWATQNDPIKRETIAKFSEWRKAQGLPPVDLRIDNASIEKSGNSAAPKELVQGASGMGGDLLDVYQNQMEMYQATGMLADLTDDAKARGYDVGKTYAQVAPYLQIGGRQFGFPRNVDVTMCWINVDTFARYRIPLPPARWTWDEFEALGKKFVAAANPPGTRQRVFFLNRVEAGVVRRGIGFTTFNETQTRCTLDDPRNAEVLKAIYRWTIDLRLMPTAQEQDAIATDMTGWDSSFSLFASGRFAMLYEGLWALIRLRELGNFKLAATEPFHAGFPNTQIGSGAVAVYAGSKHLEAARDFIRFLTSEPFNVLIAKSGDSLPPLPSYTATEAYRHPPEYPNDWSVKDAFATAGREIGLAQSKSPFVLPSIVYRTDLETIESVLANRATAEEAAKAETARLNDEIALRIRQDAGLAKLYAEREKLQRQIEARRAAGQKVPAAWISDPFHLAYYRQHGWLEDEAVTAGEVSPRRSQESKAAFFVSSQSERKATR